MLCQFCGLIFLKKKTLQLHIKEFHSLHIHIWRCNICDRPFSRKFNLKRHLVLVHNVPVTESYGKMTNSAKVTREELDRMRKPVYFDHCEEMTSDEETMEPLKSEMKYEDIYSDEEM